MRKHRTNPFAFSIIGLALAAAVSLAQTPPTIGPSAQTARDNASGGGVRTRTPGQMVQNGVSRHSVFSDRQSAGTVITEPPHEEPFPGLIAEALNVVFDQINAAITAFRTLLITRAGQTPVINGTNTADGGSNSGGSGGGGRR